MAINVWHNAKIDLPKPGEQVLCVKETKNGTRSLCFGFWYDDRTYGNGWVTSGSCNNVLYWMPLPKIPEV
ncbi:MAG: DUF551 domain-containing protein [Clostridium sp.]|nr:DUF551 domain-containing protein [Clostridium sp.]